MLNNASDNKRLAINTIILYGKLAITIIISFWTSRLVLDALGASDYGLYNVVGGIVALLNTLGTSMVATSYRYMAVELGKGESGNPNKIYNTVFIIHLVLAIFLLLVGETLGVFYINNYLNVSADKIPDALFVLHLSLLTTAFSVITIPSNGLIIAREKFLFTSIVEIVSSILKLAFILALAHMVGNKLRYYAIMLAVVQFISPAAYQIYCSIKDKEIVKWNFNRDKSEYKGILGFASWMLIGALACMARVQGAAMVINYFFGTILNAAFGLATQIFNATDQFSRTLRQAAVPQIMKSQSAGEGDHSLNIVYRISRYTYLCMLIPAIPIIICLQGALHIWLDTPPDYTDIFIILMLVNGMIANLSAGFDASIQATGKVRKNQIGYSLINLALIPIMFIAYKAGLPPYWNCIIMIMLTICTLVFQCGIMRELTNFKIVEYLKVTIIPSLLTTFVGIVPLLLFIKPFNCSLAWTIAGVCISLAWTIICIFLLGLSNAERSMMILFIKSKLLKYHSI